MATWSIRARLGVAHGALLVVSSAMLMLLSWRFESRLVRDGIQERAETLVQAITRSVAFPLAVGDHEALARQVAGFAAAPDILAIEVLDPNGVALASGGALRRWNAPRTTIDWGSLGDRTPAAGWRAGRDGELAFVCVHPVTLDEGVGGGERVGAVRMAISSARSEATLRGLRRSQLAASLVLVGLALATARLIARRIAVPIERLTAAAEAIAGGRGAALSPVSGPAEVGRLAEAFGSMMRAVEEHSARVRELAAREVARARTDWDATFDAITDMILVHDDEGRVIRANRAFRESALRHDVEGAWLRTVAAPRPGETGRRPAAPASDLVVGDAHLSVSSFPLPGGASVVVMRDVTERNRLREHLGQSEKMAALGLLVSGVAHEINNPLAAIVGHAELAERRAADQATRERLAKILALGDRIARLVRNLLNFARPHPPERRSVDLNELVRQCLDLRAYDHSLGRVEVELCLDETLPRFAADPHQLQQALLNLVINAEQAMQTAGHGRRLRIETSLGADARVALVVEDTGPGIPGAVLSRIFEPFFTTKPVGRGTGLGLSLVHAIVAEHDGTITARNRPAGGASFRVELPLAELPHEIGKAAPLAAAPEGRGARVLIVDDERAVLDVAGEMLDGAGYGVVAASDVDSALELARRDPPDLVLTDLRMPGKDGLDLARSLSAAGSVRVCVMTGDLANATALRTAEEMGLAVLSKPFTRLELLGFVAAEMARTVKNPTTETPPGP